MDPLELAGRLTLLLLLLRPIGQWSVRPWILVLAGAGLLLPGAATKSSLWLALAALTAWRAISDWPLADNHAYLLAYWCLALALAGFTLEPSRSLAVSARWLVGLLFAFAMLWKVGLSPDFLDGTFFRVAFLTDERFVHVASLVGGLSPGDLEESRRFLEHPGSPEGAALHEPPGLTLHEPPGLRRAASLAAVWTAGLEGSLALCFLWPGAGFLAKARHPLLLLFCATTFVIAPVAGFGWLLVSMGVAQCAAGGQTRRLYLVVYVLILVFREVPWSGFVAWA